MFDGNPIGFGGYLNFAKHPIWHGNGYYPSVYKNIIL